MAFFNEFPHTRTYDSDLAWLIDRMKDLYTRFEQLDNIVNEINQLMNEIRQMMSELDARVEEIARQVTAEEMRKYLASFARPVPGYENIRGAKAEMRRGTDWIIDQNFTGANFKINDTSTGSGALAYLIAYETYDRYLLLWEFPAQGSGASEGTCRLSLRGTAATNFDETFKIDWTEPPVIYGSLNPSRYITGERLQKASNSDNLATIYCAKQLGDFSGTVKQFFMSVKKLNEGWSS